MNYLGDLVTAGIAFTDTYAIPAGSVVTLDPESRTGTVRRFATLPVGAGSARTPSALASEIGDLLDQGMRHLAAAHPDTPLAVCLSGGADSSVIAAYTRQQFPHAVAYSYSFGDDRLSEDAAAAQHVAAHLGMPFRLVRANRQDLLDVLAPRDPPRPGLARLQRPLRRRQRAARQCHRRRPPPRRARLHWRPHERIPGRLHPRDVAVTVYYRLQNISPDRMRAHLARGVQTGDREVGVFAAHGLTVVQPYCWATTELLALPEPVSKPLLMADLARHRLPNGTSHRPKVRAQIGDLTADTGVLPQLLQADIDQRWLEAHFRSALGVRSPADLRRTIRGGIHQPVPLTPVEGDQ
ncbi:hypothetical protein QF026_001502 [Streptomyces aurantiacus]|uniref:asparagine synthase-related protein n=1 Tax=Streptomyces aurantiacus TaxID=47760 RepID=UPI00279332D8|nr:asparagine synthase-related protein [Streptomyces aurantiacus]MDQ0773036.1 hypothetical protein [Streptomyces aurantiacus]